MMEKGDGNLGRGRVSDRSRRTIDESTGPGLNPTEFQGFNISFLRLFQATTMLFVDE